MKVTPIADRDRNVAAPEEEGVVAQAGRPCRLDAAIAAAMADKVYD
jgi:hypothetical protein